MNTKQLAEQFLENAAGKFETSALAILARCEQSGVTLRMEGDHLKAKGNREIITAWQAIIGRHKPEIIAALSGSSHDGSQFVPQTAEEIAKDKARLLADYEELTACIIELCHVAGYSNDTRDRMLEARQSLYPYLYATECAYFRLQVIRAKSGVYWRSDAGERIR